MRTCRHLLALVLAILTAVGLAVIAAPAALAGGNGTNNLQQNEQLNPGQRLSTSNGIALIMQTDGNLVEYAPGNQVVWASGTNRANSVVRMQSDGNLVIIAPGNLAVWSTRTNGNPGAGLELQTDGNAVVYAQGHVAKWANGVQIITEGGPTNDVIRLVNSERARNGCPALRVDDRLRRAAGGFAADMAARNYFSHFAPSPYPRTFEARLAAVGYSGSAGENIGKGSTGDPAGIVRAWMNSRDHRSAILNCSYRTTGVGYDARNGARWVQMFGV